jgi:hypothetical protein
MPKVKAGVLGLKAVLFFSFETDFGQCDKENHGWCEGPPRPSLPSFDLLPGLHPPVKAKDNIDPG